MPGPVPGLYQHHAWRGRTHTQGSVVPWRLCPLAHLRPLDVAAILGCTVQAVVLGLADGIRQGGSWHFWSLRPGPAEASTRRRAVQTGQPGWGRARCLPWVGVLAVTAGARASPASLASGSTAALHVCTGPCPQTSPRRCLHRVSLGWPHLTHSHIHLWAHFADLDAGAGEVTVTIPGWKPRLSLLFSPQPIVQGRDTQACQWQPARPLQGRHRGCLGWGRSHPHAVDKGRGVALDGSCGVRRVCQAGK